MRHRRTIPMSCIFLKSATVPSWHISKMPTCANHTTWALHDRAQPPPSSSCHCVARQTASQRSSPTFLRHAEMPKSERDEVISKLVRLPFHTGPCTPSFRIHVHHFSMQTAMIFSAMISDLVMDATLQAHYEGQKLNVVCDICHTWYVYPQRRHTLRTGSFGR